ncbi:hypothetical protein [Vibrio sp. Hal054]|uniref:hypothetical protein n=1 Tax=Vibrio sp. Hal054 TaxID=3035158 RepID=UPI00301D1682
MQILKFSPEKDAKRNSVDYLYMVTDKCDHVTENNKGVLFTENKYTAVEALLNAQKSLNEVKRFLGTKSKSDLQVWRIDPSAGNWVSISDRKQDYYYQEYQELISKITYYNPKILSNGLTQHAINAVFGIGVATLHNLSQAEMITHANYDKYKEIRFNKNSINYLNWLIDTMIEHEFQFDIVAKNELTQEQIAAFTLSPRKSLVEVDGKCLLISLSKPWGNLITSKGNVRISTPYYRIKSKTDEQWTYFCAANITANNAFPQFFKKGGVAPFDALTFGDADDVYICNVLSTNKKDIHEIFALFDDVTLEVLNSECQWTLIDPVTDTKTVMKRDTIDVEQRYGFQQFDTFINTSPLSRKNKPLVGRPHVAKWFEWCDTVKPEFAVLPSSQQKSTEPKKRTREKVRIDTQKETRGRNNAVRESLDSDYLASLALEVFQKKWGQLHNKLKLDFHLDSTEWVCDRDRNALKDYVLKDIQGSTTLVTNICANIDRVDLERDKQGHRTIHYTNTTETVDDKFTLEQFLEVRAVETISAYIYNNRARYIPALEAFGHDKSTWNTKKTFIELIMSEIK